jgi:hypothetical protein
VLQGRPPQHAGSPITDSSKRIDMQLLFGIRASGNVTLTVTATGDLSTQPPDLRIKTAVKDIAIEFSNGTWVASVAAGDSIVYVPDQGDSCVVAPLAFTLSAPVTIIAVASADKSLISWTAKTGATIGATDVKDPWPPPGSAQTTPLADPAGWIGSTLRTMGAAASTRDFSSPVPPAHAGRPDNPR